MLNVSIGSFPTSICGTVSFDDDIEHLACTHSAYDALLWPMVCSLGLWHIHLANDYLVKSIWSIDRSASTYGGEKKVFRSFSMPRRCFIVFVFFVHFVLYHAPHAPHA